MTGKWRIAGDNRTRAGRTLALVGVLMVALTVWSAAGAGSPPVGELTVALSPEEATAGEPSRRG